MSDDYLWNRSGVPDPDTKQLEELLGPLAHDAPFDEVHASRVRKRELVRATAHEQDQLVIVDPSTTQAPRASRRVKGKMRFLDKRVIGAASLTAAAIALVGVNVYKSRVVDDKPRDSRDDVGVALPLFGHDNSFDWDARRFAAVTPMTDADLAITAGESVRIHSVFGGVDVEIQSACNAEVELAIFKGVLKGTHVRGMGLGHFLVVEGAARPDGRATTYHLGPNPGTDLDPALFEYTSTCVGQPPTHGMIAVDRDEAHEPIGQETNARVYSSGHAFESSDIHVFGSVLPGATISVGANHVELQPPDFDGDDPIVAPTFSTDVPIVADHPVAAVRVDDAHGTHFYVFHPAEVLAFLCTNGMRAQQQIAADLAAKGDHAGALAAIETGLTKCK